MQWHNIITIGKAAKSFSAISKF